MDKSAEALSLKVYRQTKQLMKKYELLRVENKSLNEKIQQKNNDLIDAHTQITELRKKNADLMLANMLGVTEEERKMSKQRLTKMMREIDKCIALLTK
jgi:hypothetical protein